MAKALLPTELEARARVSENVASEADGIELYIQYLEAQAAGQAMDAKRLLNASVALGEPMALHAAAYFQERVEDAVSLYAAAARAGFAPSAWNLYLHYSDLGDVEAAARWLESAAHLGDQDALKLIGAGSRQ